MKRSEYLAEKKETAKYINQSIIQSGQTIYLDAGTSTYELIDYLRDKRITVVTNSTYHLPKLINNKNTYYYFRRNFETFNTGSSGTCGY